ncbi:peroxide stress protein YaaA [Lactobacillus crispatus]|uniref:peroxide stress protein YaaA n=1 Tax=Lactobacillus crispatus TaxID=47770 RepID=UPI0022AC0793|nr:peroxide stress protein YaaA [Lactobacillus crispatus]MCZ3920029.1 peroxide stress protein YaaA [Lactobacillus crispatus]MCZ3926077.1 peroxide stress protein YaaA [Lactobacillus crispatus]MCZ4018253.1 peroxide stress protein YaaA [Lactobacillus crispatus]MCZ4049473.1 peroxide stress protein YaaA [Lactobacillus crispatus]
MKIIIAPAKIMKIDRDSFPIQSKPQFLDKTRILERFLKSRSNEQLKDLWHASENVTKQSILQLENMNLDERLTPAILAFSGIQYQYMAPDLFTQPALDYIQKNLRILSGFYGMLRPFDGVCPYRLELNTKMVGFRDYSLYYFWGSYIAENLFQEDNIVIDLASKQYTRLVKPYLSQGRQLITVDFQELKNGKWKTVGVHAKMARGEMVRYIAEKQIKNPTDLQDFNDFEFQFEPDVSTKDHYVFRTEFDFTRR